MISANRETLEELESQLTRASQGPRDSVERIDALNALAWELRNADLTRANSLASEARQRAIESRYKLGQARAARTMAMTARDSEGLRTMYRLAEEAKDLFDEVGDGPGMAASRDFLSTLREFLGDLAGGLELALDALSIARSIGDPVRQGYALSSVGGILAASGEPEVALDRLREALGMFEQVGDPWGTGTILNRLAKVSLGAGQHREALEYARRCHELAVQLQDDFGRWAGLSVMADVRSALGELEEAESLYREALRTLEMPLARDVVGAETQLRLGQLLLRRGAVAAAKLELEDAVRRVRDDSVSFVTEALLHETLADVAEGEGDLRGALDHLRRAQALRGQISKHDARNKMAQVEVRAAMEAAKQDAEQQRLRFAQLSGHQSKLVEAQKMDLLSRLAAGTAHELNTPLGVLQSNFELIRNAASRLAAELPEGHARLEKLGSVLASCAETTQQAMLRIGSLAQQFQRFTQLDQAEQQRFDVREGLESALSLLSPTVSRQVTVRRRFEDVPPIVGWPRELNQAFFTVLQNAVEAVGRSGEVTVETFCEDGRVVVVVRDTGPGMSPERAERLFELGWSEKGTRAKMALGLSAAYATVHKHNGSLVAESELGRGTAIIFRFLPHPS